MKSIMAAVGIFILIGCEKSKFLPAVDCQPCYLLSDKYTPDSVYKRTDTLWKDPMLCGRWLDSVRAQKPASFVLCADRTIENQRYVIGNQVSYAVILK